MRLIIIQWGWLPWWGSKCKAQLNVKLILWLAFLCECILKIGTVWVFFTTFHVQLPDIFIELHTVVFYGFFQIGKGPVVGGFNQFEICSSKRFFLTRLKPPASFMILYVPSQHWILSHSLDNPKNLFYLVVSTPLKNITVVKLDHFSNVRGENKRHM